MPINLQMVSTKFFHFIIFGYDITDKISFEYIKKCYEKFIEKINGKPFIYLVANKIDLFDKIEVSDEDAISFAKEKNLKFFKLSAKTGEGIDLFLSDIVNSIIKKYFKIKVEGEGNIYIKSEENKILSKTFPINTMDCRDILTLNKYYNY